MYSLKYLTGPLRVPFLILTPACVLLGVATAYLSNSQVDGSTLVFVFIGALFAHISVNTFNEYFDFKSGLDAQTKRTPFSGGSGTLPEKPELAHYVLMIAMVSFLITAVIGLYFISLHGVALLPLGLAGLLVILAYTPWVTRHPVACLIAPGLGFGPVMVLGTHFVLTGEYSWTACIASLAPFFLVNNLLLLNQFPDIEADRQVGRKHYPLLIGRQRSAHIYSISLVFAHLSLIAGVVSDLLPVTSLLGLITLLIAIPTLIGVYRYAEDTPKLLPYMGMNVVINITTPLLVAVGLFIA